ncbi:bifunctional glutamate N-acetyltransferase/amino-acid acetyltransferase ArgJ [Butyricicoccus porcorum]|uniref:Arginine biosynthesis bifunctional protein ArgJ n=1 Tax=Butyricicoccus porcorum TaxID=1945634 RepID=A0A252F463_9FIRM|nr:bifunctional glutamate N-acetyltransferase/amino-acid acetyltransferase ArgJ [Butyricicoccus porcorum]MCI6926140.1 bifunctional glutamate N-acetyltransferase/amino-acid acetyltransferase ArgJ [Butyricicoccus porcorum]MDD6987199.1 bifunctional glutamate N-acetyltransferase/amino-acid acetyltransferase ArgJ [Butyricicoccus porcorum]MDY4483247.1 bifunctional glutamate N-acetyltransferase/amino-acid acetyltransferase ArgJ [Butyricicoccus porcorum]OUM20567.1 bifunctional ornithine acetyltransfera
MKKIEGGVCAATGFRAAALHCGVKTGSPQEKNDLALIVSACPAATAATFTNNRVKAAPIYVCMEHLENGVAQAIVANSGNANACAPEGMENARRMAAAAAKVTGIEEDRVLVGSTGVIGQRLNIEAIEGSMEALAAKLSDSAEASVEANRAIMTTDLVEKTAAVEFDCGGKTCHMGGIAKGSGMIHPNMGTMLCFVTTDCAIDPSLLRTALQDVVERTFNRISVDGDTSTNDTCVVMANGMAGNQLIDWKDEAYHTFYAALEEVCLTLAKKMAADGEGASKLICCTVKNSRAEEYAERLAKAVIASSLVKAAMFGEDANWGRVLCAMGYSKAPFRPEYVTIGFSSAAGAVTVCEHGEGLDFDEDLAKKVLSEKEISIDIDIHEGDDQATAFGCDLTYDYVRINGDYRT